MNLNSSLAYEILLYLNTFYLGMFVVCEVAMGILKAINVTYPENALLTEFGIFCSLCFVEMIRIFLGRRGNLASKSKYYENYLYMHYRDHLPCLCLYSKDSQMLFPSTHFIMGAKEV